ncbi:MAG: cardiolipin synthase [Lachnospiraceae bacterium]|nr:cardiolipin synthase [Lachnospiraceae bacterium]
MEQSTLYERTRKKGKEIMSRVFFSKGLPTVLFVLMQLFLLIWFSVYFQIYFESFYIITLLLVFITIIYIMSGDSKNEFKMAWILMMAFLPIFGILMYIYTMTNYTTIRLKKSYEKHHGLSMSILSDTEQPKKLLKEKKDVRHLFEYLKNSGGYPVYEDTVFDYYSDGAGFLNAMAEELTTARETIFMQFFSIEYGIVWEKIHDILVEKVKEGVEVRLIFDGTNTLIYLPKTFAAELEKEGIKVRIFAPVVPILSTYQDYRNHRKLVIIDQKIAFTGGVNIGDEYANLEERFGRWKDAGIRMEGNAVRTFTAMFLESYNLSSKDPGLEDYDRFLSSKEDVKTGGKGFAAPYGDDPLNHADIAEDVYRHMINTAKKYVYIMTPYLVIDNEMLNSLCFAAKSGVDVRIIMPHIPDKKITFCIGHTYYRRLLKAGVRIYNYTPGFIHSKVVLSDDKKAVVGTINFDYRSLYHHFEDAVYIYDNPVTGDILKDFKKTFDESSLVTYEDYARMSNVYKVVGRVLRIFESLI